MTAGSARPSWQVVVDLLLVGAALVDVFDTPVTPVQLALALLAAAALVFRRRWPVPVFVLTLPGLVAGIALIAAGVALFTVAERVRSRWVVGVGGAVVFGIAVVVRPEQPGTGYLSAIVYALVFAGGPVALGVLLATRDDLQARLVQLTLLRKHDAEQAATVALGRERAKLAREMHDVVAHQVSLIAVRAGAMQVEAVREQDDRAAEDVRRLAVATLSELRSMVGVLRASGGTAEGTAPQPSFSGIGELVADSGIDVAAHLDLPPDASPAVQRAVFRCVQEALTNARKHAPGAPVTVSARPAGPLLVVVVETGPPRSAPLALPSGGMGLVGLRERAELLGGTLDVRRPADGSHVLELRVPLRP